MSESLARAERFGPSSSSPSYLWEVASKPVSVRISLETVDRLEREAVEGFRSLSSRGSEIGGLLLGSVQSGSPARVSVEAFELVPCDYVRGPLYQFSETDVERFERAIEQCNGKNGLHVVGFFRSHTRKGLGLDAEDTAFFSGHFRDPHQVALLIRPYASKASTGGIFIWENGTVRAESSYLEFPFRRAELERLAPAQSQAAAEKPAPAPASAAPSAVTEPPAVKPPARAQIVPIASRREMSQPPASIPERPDVRSELAAEPFAPPRASERLTPPEPAPEMGEPRRFERKNQTPAHGAPEPASAETERETFPLADLVLPPLERPRRNKLVWITAGSAAALLMLSGALVYPGLGHKGKRAAGVPGQDAAALALRVERSAGELVLTWNRDSEAVKSATRGVLAISDGDQHEDVKLDAGQLHTGSIVYSPTGADVSFQLSLIGQDAAQTHSESVRILRTRPSPLADNAPPAPQKTAAVEVHAEATPKPAAAPAAAEPVPAAENKGKTAPPALREFHAEVLSQRLRPARPSDLPEAPGLTPSSAPVAVSLPALNSAPSAPVAPAAPPPSAPAAAPVRAGGQLTQAQLISHKPPEYPLVAKQNHVQGVVEVSATIGVDGKVKAASAVSGPALLQKAAVDAVRQWLYKPTLLNGAPVESETLVDVRFTTDR